MKGMCKGLCLALVWGLAAVAAPGLAVSPEKLYALKLETNPVYSGGQLTVPSPVIVTVKNESNSGANSNIGSFQFTLVGLTILNPPSCPGASCNLDTSTNTVYVTNINPPIQAPGGTFPVFLNVTSCGSAIVPIDATSPIRAKVWNGQLSGAEFTPNTGDAFFVNTASIKCGDIDCGTNFIVPNSGSPSANDPRRVAGRRSTYDTDGSCAVLGGDVVPYTVTNTLATDYLLNFAWPVTSTESPDFDPFAAFGFKLNITAPGTATPTIKFSWGGGPFIAGDACTLPTAASPPGAFTDLPLPAPYAILSANISDSDTKIKVNTAAGVVPVPSAAEFDIMIGAERMHVSKHTTNVWTVVREQGGTQKAPHYTNDQVVRTAQPLVDETGVPAFYTIGDKAQACVAYGPVYNGDGTWSAWVIASGDPGVSFSP